jgi:hypothetical protein
MTVPGDGRDQRPRIEEDNMNMTLALAAAVMMTIALSASAATAGNRSRSETSGGMATIHDLSLELVGQVSNSPAGVTPATSDQYGYVTYLRGLPVFSGDTQDETTALFTFYTDTTTMRVINNGPIRIIDREGMLTIFRHATPGANFASPDTFRAGTPVLTAGLRQQVVIDTLTGAFTASNLDTITSTRPFAAGTLQLQLGEAGQRFKTLLSGHSNSPTPSAYMAGYTIDAPGAPASAPRT